MGAAPQPDWAADAERRLSEAGFRRGGARTAVIALLDRQPCALTAQDIERDLRDGGRAVGRASVYRILDELVSLGLVARVEVGQGVARYEPARGEAHHHHMVCDSCGDVLPFADEELERAIRRLAGRVAFDVSEHDIVLRGSCADCRAADGDQDASARAPRTARAAP
jgi:Fur family ferric uptake transcriptional regulator